MKKIIRHIILILFISGNLIIAQQPVLKVSPSEINLNSLSIGEIVIQVENINALRAYSIHLSYDSQKLRCLSMTRLSFFSNWQTFFYPYIDSNLNKLKIDEAILGTGYSNGSGDLFKIEFQALTEGDINLNFLTTDLRDTSNSLIQVQTVNGIVHIFDPTSIDEIKPDAINNNLLAYPNPFNSLTRIEYNSIYKIETVFDIYSIIGEKVFSFISEPEIGSNISFLWNGLNMNGDLLSSGMYLLTARNKNEFKSFKIIMLK